MRWMALGGVAVLLMVGCPTPTAPPPPPPPGVTGIMFSWEGSGNPSFRNCGTGVVPQCLEGYVLRDEAGKVVAAVPMSQLSFLYSPAPMGSHSYSLTVDLLNTDGTLTETPKALTSVTLK